MRKSRRSRRKLSHNLKVAIVILLAILVGLFIGRGVDHVVNKGLDTQQASAPQQQNQSGDTSGNKNL